MDNVQIVVAGAAGEGSKKAGLLIAKLFNSYGFKVFIREDYQSVIQGGHNFSYISATQEEHNAMREGINFVLALNKEAVVKHIPKLYQGGILIYDQDATQEMDQQELEGVEVIPLSLNNIVKEAEGIPLMKNTALVASFAKIMGMSLEKLKTVLEREIKKETEKNLQVAEIAYYKADQKKEIKEVDRLPQPLLSGNEALAVGAVEAGLECYFAYPMTPSTTILGFLSNLEGVRTFQPENEIAVINAGIGSAYAGRRTMVGTSGGGFALMTEGISLSAQAEVPIVIALSQRMGPASGVPTYQGQGDLLFALSSGHGDMVRLVVAPGDSDEAYYWGGEALNLSWEYQVPAIVMLDKELSENRYELNVVNPVTKREGVMADNKEDYLRYAGEDISPMAFPGEEGVVVKGTSYEHTPKGVATEDEEEIEKMQNKRLLKHEKLRKAVEEMTAIKTYQEGKVAVIFWGSTKGVVIEATKNLPVKLIQPLVFQPFPSEQMKKALEGVEKVITVETNATGQMGQVLKGEGVKIDEEILKYNGRPFTVEELSEKIKRLI